MNKPKNPWVAGLLNAILPGVGFIYLAPAFKNVKKDVALFLQVTGLILFLFTITNTLVSISQDGSLKGYQDLLGKSADIAAEFNPSLAEGLKVISVALDNHLSSSSLNLVLSFLHALVFFLLGYTLAILCNTLTSSTFTNDQPTTTQIFCKACGVKNEAGTKFCASCGKQI